MLVFALASAFAMAGPASATVINGDFETGDLTGFIQDKSGASAYDFSDFVSIETEAGNAYVEVTTGTIGQALSNVAFYQILTIPDDTPIFRFDAKLTFDAADPISGTSLFVDNITAFMFDESFAYYPFFALLEGGGAVDPFGGSPAAAAITTLTGPSNPFFDYGVEIDLSAFVGQEVWLGISANSYSDSRILSGAFDNFSLSSADELPSVPLPASLPLLVAALGGGLFLGRKRRDPRR